MYGAVLSAAALRYDPEEAVTEVNVCFGTEGVGARAGDEARGDYASPGAVEDVSYGVPGGGSDGGVNPAAGGGVTGPKGEAHY